jgi:hypothetical protein
MAISVKLVSKRQRGRIDVVELVTRRAEALRSHLSASIIGGVSPVDGTARKRKPDGKPMHFRTGRLGRKLRLGNVRRSRHRAQVEIRLPHGQPTDPFLVAWVAKHDEVLTTVGAGQRVLA